MGNILISGIIIFVCLVVFVVMCILVVSSKKEADRKKILGMSKLLNARMVTEIERLRKASSNFTAWSSTIKMHDEDVQLKKQMAQGVQKKIKELELAIDIEDYELAATLRDDIDNLKTELKKFKDS